MITLLVILLVIIIFGKMLNEFLEMFVYVAYAVIKVCIWACSSWGNFIILCCVFGGLYAGWCILLWNV